MKKCLIVMGGMSIGGAQKSLINFLNYIKDFMEIDLLLWNKSVMEYNIPDGINIITDFPTVKSVESAIKIDGLFSKTFLLSVFAAILYKKRWLCSPKIKKDYDFAIAYTTVGTIKYYVIDSVNAKQKFLWYHHGSYEQVEKIKEWDNEYFPKYDNVITVSNANKEMLSIHFPKLKEKILVVQNFLNDKEIIELSKEPIANFADFDGLKLTTVGRLSEEKGQLFAIEVAKSLKQKGKKFKWLFVGEGELRHQLEEKINEYDLNDFCILVGNKNNPYPYIKSCDIYVQTSYIEADPLTIYEAKVLEKNIIASNIPAIEEALDFGKSGIVCEFNAEKFAKLIIEQYNSLGNDRNIEFPSRNSIIENKIKKLFQI